MELKLMPSVTQPIVPPEAQTPGSDSGVGGLLRYADVDDTSRGAAERQLTRVIRRLGRLGVRRDDLGVVGQAYIRAVARMAAAEAEVISMIARAGADGGQEAYAWMLVEQARALGRETFDVLHESMLRKAMRGFGRAAPTRCTENRQVVVAHVDVVGSTAFLARASLTDTQRLVDGLFASAQSAIAGRQVDATKYVGDGVYFVGSEPIEVARASMECLRRLMGEFELTARGGLASGLVVHRAGDVFGLPVNLSHILTKSARPGTILAAASAAAGIPLSMRAEEVRPLDVAGLSSPLEAVELSPGCDAVRPGLPRL